MDMAPLNRDETRSSGYGSGTDLSEMLRLLSYRVNREILSQLLQRDEEISVEELTTHIADQRTQQWVTTRTVGETRS